MNYCPYCGKPLRGCESSFCEGCTGMPHREEKDNADRFSENSRKKKLLKGKGNLKKHSQRQEQMVFQSNPDDGYYDDILPEDNIEGKI